jgi:hypothetical protein
MLDRILMGSSAEASDPNFKNVTLLLHGDGSNGAQNNTFIDSSTNNFTITRNGNTTQGSFSPYGSNWSNYFDGSGDMLYLNGETAFSFGTGDFTVEGWFCASATGEMVIIDFRPNSTNGAYPMVFINSSGYLTYYTNTADRITGSTAIAVGTWYHFAVSRSGTSTKLFLNGVQQGSTYSDSSNYAVGSVRPIIGVNGFNTSVFNFNGYISNLRIVKGTAVYTSAFTPPTAPLTAITNTSLLTCADNRFRDGSTNNFTITRNGDVKVTNFSPFAPSSAYSTTTNGGSGYFDGNGDYLTVPDGTWSQLSSGSFTIEMWAYPNALGGYQTLISKRGATWELGFDPSNKLYWYNGTVYPTTAAVTNGQWVHVAATWDGTNLRLFINGTLDTTISGANAGSSSGETYIGAFSNQAFNGYISNLRVLKGTALYTASFTPPASPVTAITNTQLLTNFTNAAIFDNSMKNDLETVGNAQISTSVKKFGTGSMAFDGNGDYLYSPVTPDQSLGTGDFTIEGWFYTSQTAQTTIIEKRSGQTGFDWIVFLNETTGKLTFYSAFGSITTSASFNSGQWNHFAVVRNGSTTTVYLNGTSSGTYSGSYTVGNSYPLYIGADSDGPRFYFNGYVDDIRITKGVARYTANFTPPTAAFPNK